MTNLLVFKDRLKNFYGKNETYLKPALKFLMALISLMMINGNFGYMAKINNMAVVLMAALLCSFLPLNIIIVMSAAFVLLHIYVLSMEAAAVVLAVFLLLFLLYFRFTPKDTIVVLLTPICFILKIPYVIPLVMGVVGSPASVVSAGSGVVVYYLLANIKGGMTSLNVGDAGDSVQKFKFVIDGLINNKAMFVMLAAFAVTIILVHTIRRMSMDHAWTIALAAGALVNLIMVLMGEMIFDTNISIAATIIGTLFSFLLAKVLQFFVFNLDYTRTELVQFEDDEYYYYIKAVPKITVAAPEKRIKKINSAQQAERTPSQRSTPADRPVNRDKTSAPAQGAARGTGAVRGSGTGQYGAGRDSAAARQTRTRTNLK